jgi:hypothetical protein
MRRNIRRREQHYEPALHLVIADRRVIEDAGAVVARRRGTNRLQVRNTQPVVQEYLARRRIVVRIRYQRIAYRIRVRIPGDRAIHDRHHIIRPYADLRIRRSRNLGCVVIVIRAGHAIPILASTRCAGVRPDHRGIKIRLRDLA